VAALATSMATDLAWWTIFGRLSSAPVALTLCCQSENRFREKFFEVR
jgi:hypothetical protein